MSSAGPVILIVEDEKEIQDLIINQVKQAQISHQTTDNFPEAVSRLSKQKYSALILDLKILKGSGEDIVQRLRADKQHFNHAVPILIISGHLDYEILTYGCFGSRDMDCRYFHS